MNRTAGTDARKHIGYYVHLLILAEESLSKALKTIDKFENDPMHFSVLFESEAAVKELFAKAKGILTQLSNVRL